ncbi:MAG: phytanoyl-CoA dioxygenase family protein [Actinomycetota bacterium]
MPEITAFSSDDPQAVDHFWKHGWVLTQELDGNDIAEVGAWVDEVAATFGKESPVLHHREMTDFGPQLARSENFVPIHSGLRELLTVRLARTASHLLREPAVLYKEKINYKLIGGAGFSPHQDAPAYPFINSHVSCMVAVDDATRENGCLEIVSGRHHELLNVDDRGCIQQSIVDEMEWQFAPISAGQTLWFHSLTPHRSGANHSTRDRRALYPTYNAVSEGDLREAYYAEKLERLAQAERGDRVVLSLIGDFEGRPVD